jgi:hypothetical protein
MHQALILGNMFDAIPLSRWVLVTKPFDLLDQLSSLKVIFLVGSFISDYNYASLDQNYAELINQSKNHNIKLIGISTGASLVAS